MKKTATVSLLLLATFSFSQQKDIMPNKNNNVNKMMAVYTPAAGTELRLSKTGNLTLTDQKQSL